MFDLVTRFVQLEGGISHEYATHFEQADIDDAVIAQEERVEGLQAKDRISQILFITLLDRSWDLLYGCLEVSACLLYLFVSYAILQIVVGLRSAGIAG